MFSCLKRKTKNNYLTLTARCETRFSEKEIDVLRKRFASMTNGSKFISKEQFTKNMGILGLHAVSCLGNALFQAMDNDSDGHLEFEEFVRYFDKITYGTDEEKAEISFRLIDQKRNGHITYQDFSLAMQQLIQSWTIMKGNPLDEEVMEHLEKRIHEIFNLIDENNDGTLTLSEYVKALQKNPQVMDIFEFLKKGVTQTIKEEKHVRDQVMLREFQQIQQKTHSILQSLQDQSHKQQFNRMVKQVIKENKEKKKEKFGIFYLMGTQELDYVQKPVNCASLDWIENLDEKHLKSKYKEIFVKLTAMEEYTERSLHKMEELYHEKVQQNELIPEPGELTLVKEISVKNNKFKGSSVQIGQDNWNLVITMMIGIQMAVKSSMTALDSQISEADASLKHYFELMSQPNSFNSSKTKSKFYDYGPKIFNQIRKSQMIENNSYISSIGPENLLSSIVQGDMSTLSELTSTGKSGSFFYYSQDGIYTLKTISKSEFKLFKKILLNYYNYLEANPRSLLTKLYGLHKINVNDDKIYFIVMGNIFKTDLLIHKKYDIKGSLYKRTTDQNADWDVARKDQDFLNYNESLSIPQQKANQLIEQLERDSNFLAMNNILDYSLLIGIHNIEKGEKQNQFQESNDLDMIYSINGDKLFCFGIIDILTEFSLKKQIEFYYKRVVQGPTISAIPPPDYSQRFRQFIRTILQQPHQ